MAGVATLSELMTFLTQNPMLIAVTILSLSFIVYVNGPHEPFFPRLKYEKKILIQALAGKYESIRKIEWMKKRDFVRVRLKAVQKKLQQRLEKEYEEWRAIKLPKEWQPYLNQLKVYQRSIGRYCRTHYDPAWGKGLIAVALIIVVF